MLCFILQVSCLWQGKHLLSVSLSGVINYLDVDNPDKPKQVLMGHNKPITCLALHPDRHTVYTASHDGCVTAWNVQSGEFNLLFLEKNVTVYRVILLSWPTGGNLESIRDTGKLF